MSKITVKHYLNTNSKPYVINGESYYSIYILLTAKRQNTKFKSIAFSELYCEKDFEDVMNSEDREDKKLINEEITVLTNIANLVIEELNEFDTHFVTAYFNFISTIQIWDVETERFSLNGKTIDFYSKEGNKAGIKLDEYKLQKTNSIIKGISLYEFFGNSNQEFIKNFLITNKCKTNIEQTLNDINRIYFYQSFDKFKWFLNGSKKNKALLDKYGVLFEDFTELLTSSIIDKYGI